jgi:hypothetical protein
VGGHRADVRARAGAAHVSNFSQIIGELKERLHRWTKEGQYGFLFDNAEDTLSFSSFQTFNFHGWNDAPEVLEPLLFYVLHRASNEIANPKKLATFKIFLLDEAWLFIKNETIRSYVVQAQKTWRKHNAAMILATQSIKELEESGMLAIVAESCPTKIFLANPEMNRQVYREAFHLNDTELDIIAGLIPPGRDADPESAVGSRRFGSTSIPSRTGLQPTTPATTCSSGRLSRSTASPRACANSPKTHPFQPRRVIKEIGDLTMKSLKTTASPSCSVLAVCAVAQPRPPRTVAYHSQDIVAIRAKVKYTTLIVIPATEKIMEAATGDKDFWIVDVVGNFCFVHPAKPGISSNLNLITDKGNIYSFTLTDITALSATPISRSSFQPADRFQHCRRQRPRAVSFQPRSLSSPTSRLTLQSHVGAGGGRVQERLPDAAQVRLQVQGERSTLRYPVDLSRRQVHLHQDQRAGEVQRVRDADGKPNLITFNYDLRDGTLLHHPEGGNAWTTGMSKLGKKKMEFTRKGPNLLLI